MTEVELSGIVLPAEQAPLPHDENPYLVYLASLGNDESRRTMAGCLDRIAALVQRMPWPAPPGLGENFPWGSLRRQHTLAIHSALQQATRTNRDGEPEPLSPAYINKHLAALRKVLEHAWLLDETFSADDYHRAIKVKGVKGTRLPAGRNIAEAELTDLLTVCSADESPAGTRDAAIIAVLYTAGLRRAEVADACREYYDPGHRSLQIIGKGNKERLVFVPENTATFLGAWISLMERRRGALFSRIHKSGTIGTGHMTPGAYARIVNKRRKQAGLPELSPHDFRRSFIGNLLDAGVDLATAQQLAGHESAATTARYDRRPERTKKEAIDRLRIPAPADLRRNEPLPHDDRSGP
jgi:site-specific recombinase XerD